MKTYGICTLGCKVNTYESQSINEQLRNKGFIEKDFKDICDIYIIFTCAVTNVAASKSRKMIHSAISRNPDAIICVVGCYVQVDVENLAKEDKIDILIGTKYKDKLADYIEQYQNERINKVESLANIGFENLDVKHFEHHTRAYLKIQDGCNQYCSYCIIPYARGHERSMDPQLVVSEARQLSKTHHEIILAGIHTGRYGKEYNYTLAKMIKEILANCPDLKRIRISSIEITEIDDELIALLQNDQRVAKHLHIPLQSGCDETLRRMNRPYTTKEFLDRITDIRNRVSDISISTDLIVGFVDESEEEFSKTYQFLKDCNFSFLHVFPFASKKGTKASLMKGQLSNDIKKQRVKTCLELSEKLKYKYEVNKLNKKVEVLVEGYENGYSYGYSSDYVYTYIEGEYATNSMVTCVIDHISDNKVYAKGGGMKDEIE